jgi:hypothetical protein
LTVELALTDDAADYISARGSRLFLWQEPVGKGWSADGAAFEDPNRGTPFTAFQIEGVTVLLADDLDRPTKLRIRLDRLPRRIHIEWDGARWSRRGDGAP